MNKKKKKNKRTANRECSVSTKTWQVSSIAKTRAQTVVAVVPNANHFVNDAGTGA